MVILILICVFISICNSFYIQNSPIPKLILISFDGFRWDYLENYTLPNIQEYFVNDGVKADRGLKNSFTTVTFPNHWSLATGLYPESHGIVGNIMYDPKLKQVFDAYDTLDNNSIWYGQNKQAIPIWILNQLQYSNQNRKSGIVGAYPGSLSRFHNQSVYLQADFNYPDEINWFIKVETLVDWFLNEGINFGVLYFPEPDDYGHIYGPYNKLEMSKILSRCDYIIGYLIEKLKTSGLFDQINIIITTDHGMESVSEDRATYLDKYVDITKFKSYGGLSYRNIFPNDPNDTDALYTALKKIPNYNVYRHDEIPVRLDYMNNVRTGPIVMYGQNGYEIFTSNTSFNWKSWNGDHGYDNTFESMHGIFVARGPAFKKNYIAKQFNITDVYVLMCSILELQPAPNNGSFDHVKDLLSRNDIRKIDKIYLIISYKCHDNYFMDSFIKFSLILFIFILIFHLTNGNNLKNTLLTKNKRKIVKDVT